MKTPEQIIKEYNRYIKTIAMRYNQPQFIDDMISVGQMAAIQAYERLDQSKINNDEKSYITTYIKGSIMNFLTTNARTISIPRNVQQHKDEEERITTIPTISTSTPVGDDGSTIEDFIPSNEHYISPEPNKAIKTALMTLSEKERLVLELHLDLNDTSQPMTLKAVGDELGVSRERARQLYQRAITKLQGELGAEVKKNKLTHLTTYYERVTKKK
jgi:RNA polymerase sigma factor (sigma-70 family)